MGCGRTRGSNPWDLQKTNHHEDWQLNATNVGKAAKIVNHPSNLPEVEYTVDKPDNYDNGKLSKSGHNLRKSTKQKQRLDLQRLPITKQKKNVRYIKQKQKNRKTYLKILQKS